MISNDKIRNKVISHGRNILIKEMKGDIIDWLENRVGEVNDDSIVYNKSFCLNIIKGNIDNEFNELLKINKENLMKFNEKNNGDK